MDTFDYLIIGGGMVADAAARGIREHDSDASIGILSADVDEPYARPALSKKLWVDPDFEWEQTPLGTADDTGAQIRLETLVTSVDRGAKTVTTKAGTTVGYGRLLLATGSKPNELDGPASDRILYFRSADDYRTLRSIAPEGSRMVVIGGGYIGTEIAAALAQNGVQVELVFSDDVLGASTFPPELAARFEALFSDGGVTLHRNRTADAVVPVAADEIADPVAIEHGAPLTSGVVVTLDDGTDLSADGAVFGLGAEPVVDLAAAAGLDIEEGGVLVDERLRTSDGSIWAAGDIARYPDPVLGRTRVEHVDNATEMGGAVGRSMAGATTPYAHTPYFYSQVFGVRWEAVGVLDPSLDVLVVDLPASVNGAASDGARVAYYRDESGAPVGVLLWDVEQEESLRDAARSVIADAPTADEALRARIR